MKLVSDWRECWRWTSVHAMVAAAAVQGAWMGVGADLQQYVPQNVVHGLTITLLALGFVGRLRDQTTTNALPKPTIPPSNDFHQGKDA
jgi:hypothetical protein